MAKLGVAVLLALLAAVIWMGIASVQHFSGSEPLPASGIVAMWLGIGFSLVVGIGLMTLVFYSSRTGYDEPPRISRDKE
jgi:hypothetical protein